MALVPRLDLRQTQSLVMTQQLQQAIKLLQLNNVELTEFVNQELEKNPLLEKEDDKLERLDIENKNIDDFNSSEEPMVENISEGVIEKDNLSDIDLDNSFSDSVSDSVLPNDKDFQDSSMNLSNLSGGGSGGSLNFSESTLTIEDSLSKKTTLRDHIISQIHFDMPDKIDRVIALAYMEMLDETGYLLGDVEDVVKKLGCSEFRAKDVLWQLQQFDPAGIFSRSLKECLTLQLKDKGIFDDKFAIVLDNLGLLAKREYAKLKKLCDVGDQAIKEIVEDIKLLNPKPAIGFAGEVIEAVTPDVFVRKKTNGDWYVELNNATLPRVLINHTYHNEIKKIATTKDSKKFLSENMNSANWLVKILHQRATTILKVSTEIVKKQEAFFEKGIEYMKPMVLRDVAEEIEMHESTVSRVTNNKYISTPRGVFELKYFFSQGISSSFGGADLSSEAVKYKIKALIEKETDAKSVLSDDKIVVALKLEGVDIARRTVAKYREAMKIPSSAVRKREKKNLLVK